MQNAELQAMTVVQLRKLARQEGIVLGTGVDKATIVQRIADAFSVRAELNSIKPEQQSIFSEKDEPSEESAKETVGKEPETIKAEPKAAEEVKTDFDETKDAEATPKAEEAAPSAADAENQEGMSAAMLSADVTSAPAGGYRMGWQSNGYRPEGKSWQVPVAPTRDNMPKPTWQSPIGGGSNRFGPRNIPAQDLSSPSSDGRNGSYGEPTMTTDGYRLGYRAAPQRQNYGGRNDYSDYGGYQQRNAGGYQPRNSYQPRNNYQPDGYRPGGYKGGYQQPDYQQPGYNQGYQQSGYQQPRGYAPKDRQDGGFAYNDSPYRMARDPQFAEQAENGVLPDMMQVVETVPAKGILEILPDGYGFMRTAGIIPNRKDIYVSAALIRRYNLRVGDELEGQAKPQRGNDKYAALMTLEKVNGEEAAENMERIFFDDMVAVYPNQRIVLEDLKDTTMAMRLVDLIAPIGFGQRAKINCPPDSGRLVMLGDIGRAILRNDPKAKVLMLLIDVAPEEVTEIRDGTNAEVYATTFADSPEMQIRISETMLERAQRLVEQKNNVVILLDSLTKLTRAYQNSLSGAGRPMSSSVSPAALIKPKKFFGAARNTREGGSLTMIATIAINTGNRMDDIIYEEFRGTANMELTLCTRQTNDPVYPMIDLQTSGTKKDDNLLNEEQREGLLNIRRVLGSATNGEAVVQLIDMMKKTKCNQDLLKKLKEWIVLWEKSGYLKK